MSEPGGRADWGIDAPGVVRGLLLAGVAGLAAAVCARAGVAGLAARPRLAAVLVQWGFWAGGSWLLTGATMLLGSKVLKLRLRDRLLDGLALGGDERVLDVGCGRGLLLVGAARRLPRGRAVGIDLWQTKDQAGNDPERTRANARAEGVAERVEIHTGDMRKLPFEDGAFDAVVSSFAIHNVPDAEGRRAAVAEIARVLKRGGRVAIADILYAGRYVETLRAAGMRDVSLGGPSFLFVIPTRVVTGTKPS
jgi:SAM-dependent methyltransferase